MCPECERYGIDQQEADRRLALFGLGPDADEAVERAHRALRPHVGEVVRDFYDQLLREPHLQPQLQDADRLERLKLTQKRCLQTLGVDRSKLQYFESRLRFGRAQVGAGVLRTSYLGASAVLASVIARRISSGQGAEAADILATIHRLLMLDADLALTSSQGREQDALVESLRHDALTGLDSRAYLMSRLTEECARAERFGRPFALVFIDLDGFKAVNDTSGHEVGDAVLVEVATCIRRAVRPSDITGRYGGDEFIAGIVEGDETAASLVAERIRGAVVDAFAETPAIATLSLGVALRRPGEDLSVLISRADAAMYEAKRGGRNRYVLDR